MEMKKPEILAPAGNIDIMKTAFEYGADAAYLGGELYGLRAGADNFTIKDIEDAINYAHERGKRIYITANITAHNRDLKGVKEYFTQLNDIKPDALIISDPGVFMMAKEYCPSAEIHVSTQSNNVNYDTFKFWGNLGATRVVTARELSIKEIGQIRENIPEEMEIETFVHGAMCISYSGRCLLSNFLTGRDANLGACTHPCRWKYYLMEETREGEYFPVFENDRGTYIFNSKDLCMIEHIPDLVKAGINSFKIEGRMKTELYVATVTGIYRKALDDYFESEELYNENKQYYMDEINKSTNRRFTTGFFYGKPSQEAQIYDNSTYVKGSVYLGRISEVRDGYGIFEQKNKFSTGDELEVLHPDGTFTESTVVEMRDEYDNVIESCPHPKKEIKIKLDTELKVYDIMRSKGEKI